MVEWFREVPKEINENLSFRKHLCDKARNDTGLQRVLKEICKNDILFWVNAFVWTYDPRLKHKCVPFITYPQFQDGMLLGMRSAIIDQEPLVVPKSRDMGASWGAMLVFDHMSTFERDCQFFALSRKGELVDKRGSRNSLFWKIDFVHQMMPAWLRPEIYKLNGVRTAMMIQYLETNSTVSGGTTSKAAEVGGRATAGLVDEYSRYEPTAAAVVKSGLTGDVTDCVIWPFTRNPEMGKFHPCQELVDQGKRGDIRYMPLHWTMHPRKIKGRYDVDPGTRKLTIIDNEFFKDKPDYKFQMDGRFTYHSEWFDRYRKKKGNDREVSVNLEFEDDINDNLTYDPLMIKEHAALYGREPDVEGDILYDHETGEFIEFIVKRGGPIKLWMPLDHNNRPPEVEFVASADVSQGVGTTNSVLSACRIDIGEKVLEFATPFMRPQQFARKSLAVLYWLNGAGKHGTNHRAVQRRTKICWERQGPGETFGDELIELGYYPVWEKRTDKVGMYTTTKAGWPPTTASKQILHNNYETGLRDRTFINHSRPSLEETLEYENTAQGPKHKADRNRKIDPSGAALNHGDRVVPDALNNMMLRELGVVAKAEEKSTILPGSLAWLIREEEEAKEFGVKELYPHWDGSVLEHRYSR